MRTAWDFESIAVDHTRYLEQIGALGKELAAARTFGPLADAGRREWRNYQDAMRNDPFLPRTLLPKQYRGADVHKAHSQFRVRFSQRLLAMIDTG